MRVIAIEESSQQFRHVKAALESIQVTAPGAEQAFELRFGQQVESVGRFAEEH